MVSCAGGTPALDLSLAVKVMMGEPTGSPTATVSVWLTPPWKLKYQVGKSAAELGKVVAVIAPRRMTVADVAVPTPTEDC